MKNRGFTLIELLIVIAIATIIAGAMVPMFNVTKVDARRAKILSELEAIKTAAINLRLDTGQWPIGKQSGETSGRGLINNYGANYDPIPDWKGPYIDSWQNDPWGKPYELFVQLSGKGLGALSDGPNKICDGGTNDDITIMINPEYTEPL